MKLQLVLSRQTDLSQSTEAIWRTICDAHKIPIEIMDISSADAQRLMQRLDLKTFPALILEGRIIAVGHPDQQTANKILQSLIKH